jgi:hypothetical protein
MYSAIQLAPEALVGRVFRAIIVRDHHPSAAAREALAPIAERNLLARALGQLLDVSESLVRRTDPAAPVAARLPLAARWLAEVSGRALALMEDRFLRLASDDWIAFHHALFGPHEPDTAPPAVTFRSAKEWERRVNDAFRGGHYARVDELCSREEAKEWRTPGLAVYQAFSLLAAGKVHRALDVATEGLEIERSAGDLHFVCGLCHARLGQVRDAGWSFARSARLLDTEVDDVLKEVSRRLEVRWTYEDS